MDDLIAWLRQQLDDDEQTAKAAERVAGMEWNGEDNGLYNESDPGRMPGPFFYDEGADEEVLAHIARHDPAAVLADIAAKRAVLDLCARAEIGDSGEMAQVYLAEEVISLLASAYRHRPGWRTDWEA